jgi:hypothetical protein
MLASRGQSQQLSALCAADREARHHLVAFSDEILDLEPKVGEGGAHHGQERLGDLNALAPLGPRQLLMLDVVGGHERVGAIRAPGVDDLGKEAADDLLVFIGHSYPF